MRTTNCRLSLNLISGNIEKEFLCQMLFLYSSNITLLESSDKTQHWASERHEFFPFNEINRIENSNKFI